MGTVKAIIFDLDDTLYSEVEYCRSGLRATASFVAQTQPTELDSEEIFSVLWDQFQQGNRSRTLNTGLSLLGIPFDDKLIRSLIGVYRKHLPQIELPQESRRVLNKLAHTYTLALLTDGFLPAQRLKVQALKIKKYFRHIVFTEQLGRLFWKPSPVGFQQLCQVLGVPGGQMVYVGDNPAKDFIAPNSLGFTTIQIKRSDRIHDTLAPNDQAQADHVLGCLDELPRYLESLIPVGQTSP